jgi:glycosyltransferase involved in cell wall biosynthesis
MNGEAPVTAVIPTFNCGSLVAQAVESVLAQTVPPSQIIVVDDGSTDDTCSQLTPHLHRIHYILQPNQGVSTARNRGLAEAHNDIVAFLDADDVWHPRKLELQLEAFCRHKELGLLGTEGFDWPTTVFPELPTVPTFPLYGFTWRQLVVKSQFVTSTVMIRREVLAQVGTFDTGLRRAEDRDLYIRVAKKYRVANLNLPLTGFRQVAGSLSRQVPQMRLGGECLLQKVKMDRDHPLGWLLQRQALSCLDYNCANTCEGAGQRLQAIGYLLKSMARYPLPFERCVMRTFCERPKRLFVLLARLLIGQAAEMPAIPVLQEGQLDALEALARGSSVEV